MARIIDGERKNLIGGNLKRLRRQRKMSQQQLSNKLGCKACTYAAALSRGSRTTPAR